MRFLSPSVKPYWSARHHLTVDRDIVLKGERIVVPKALRAQVLADLHAAHQGFVRSKSRARQTVYWPNITKDIEQHVRACDTCRLRLPSQPSEPPLNDHAPQLPFDSVSADLFQCQGQHFIVYVDRLTGWPCVARLGHSTTSHAVIIALRRWFPDIGVPAVLMTDGGPQFSSRKFAEYCQRWGIDHISSSPHYPQSNGHAEVGVKAMKTLIVKTTTNLDTETKTTTNLDTESFARGLLEWRNTPNASGKSPAQLLLGRLLSSFILTHRRDFDGAWTMRADSADSMPGEQLPPSPRTSGRILPNLPLGTHVDIQDPTSKLWTRRGVIVGIGRHRDYNVKLPSGRILWRNRRYLRPRIPAILIPSHDQPTPTQSDSSSASQSSQPRRSHRRRQPPTRLNISSTHGQSYV